jgi:hypothetical protein
MLRLVCRLEAQLGAGILPRGENMGQLEIK